MISLSFILTVLAIVLVFVILFKLLGLVSSALNIPAPWAQIIYWVLVLVAVIWALGALGIMQPIIN